MLRTRLPLFAGAILAGLVWHTPPRRLPAPDPVPAASAPTQPPAAAAHLDASRPNAAHADAAYADAAHADAWGLSGYWVQLWQTAEDQDFRVIGILELVADAAGVRPYPWAFTYFGREIASPVPDEPPASEPGPQGVRLLLPSAAVEDEAEESYLWVRFDPEGPNQLAGPVTRDGRDAAYSRLVRIPDRLTLLKVLDDLREQIRSEVAVSERQIPPLRQGLRFWMRRMDEGVRLSEPPAGVEARQNAARIEAVLGTEQARLDRLRTYERKATAMLAVVAADLEAKGPAFE